MKNVGKISFVIMGTLIGAGFASGKEIYLFFSSYGTNGIYGAILSSVLTGLIIYQVLSIIQHKPIHSYSDFLQMILPEKIKQKKGKSILPHIVNLIINIFLLISFYIMIAGFSAYFYQEFKIPMVIGAIVISVALFFTFLGNVEGMVKVNILLIPILILFLLGVGIKNGEMMPLLIEDLLVQNNTSNWIVSAILYASYNSITLIPILITLQKYGTNNRQIIYSALWCTITMLLLAIIIMSLLLKIDIDIATLELPMVYVTNLLGKVYQYIYGFIIISSIFTSAISAGFGFLTNVATSKKSYFRMTIFICFSAVSVCFIGFSNLVELLYPIFGYLGMIQLFLVFHKRFMQSIEKKQKNWYK